MQIIFMPQKLAVHVGRESVRGRRYQGIMDAKDNFELEVS